MSRYGNRKGNEPIAIIGSGCRFPGEANTPSKLWELLRQPRDLSTTILPDRFSAKGFYHPDGLHHGSSNVQESYFLSESLRHFDAQFFGIKPVEANATDPQQRLLLETVYESIESAGLLMEELRGSKTAVYVGLMSADYDNMLLRDTDTMPTYHATGVGRSIISNRISYFFDWRGPSMTIDTACSSSLIAMHQAVQVLRSGDSRVAVAAGSNLILGPENYIAESKLKMLSPTGHSRMWDHNADGYARGEGVAAVVLKTLSSALEDGDHIECLVRETGINQDGRTKGITMPSASAQAALIRDTYAKAGLDLSNEHDRCQYFEAHGTGTPAGDPIEAEAIDAAFFGSSTKSTAKDCIPASERSPLYVGSIKTVVGHTEGTAGIAAVFKASLALQHGVIPPNLLFTQLNPSIEPFYDNLEVPTAAKSWPSIADGHPRRASVNSFGFGGANAHAILESYDPMTTIREEENKSDNASVFSPFCFSASSESSLVTTIGAYSSYLKTNKSTNLRDLAWTLGARRSALPLKASFSALTVESLCAKLDAKLEVTTENTDLNIGARSSRISSLDPPRVLGVFTGQGAQWAGMGRDLILGSAFVRNKLESLENRLADLPLADRPEWSLQSELLKDSSTSRLGEAAIAQPLCTAIQIVLVDLLHSAGIKLQAVVGHSSGEIGAAYAAGYISAHDAICIAYYRGFHAHLACGPEGMRGAMMAVGTSHEDAQELCKLPYFEGRIFVAASNSTASVTISGDADAIHEAQVVFEDEKKFTRLLIVDKAYHSHHMIPCSNAYLESLQACNIQIHNPSQSTWISSVYNEDITKVRAELTDVYWNSNMVRPVLFTQAIENVFATAGPFDIAVEIGPHPALKGPATQTMHDISAEINVPYTGLLSRGKNDIEACADVLGFFWSSFGDSAVDFESYQNTLSGGVQARLLKDLPAYSWEHERGFWHESRLSRAFRTSNVPVHELLGRQCQDGTEQQLRWRNLLRPKEISWLQGHQLQGQMVFPAAGYVATALEASKVLVKEKSMKLIEVQDFVIRQAMVFNDDEYGIETLFTLGDVTIENEDTFLASFMYYSAVGKDSDAMTLMASGKLKVVIGEPLSEILPPRLPEEPNLVDIETDRFYSSLEQLGYGYTGPFKALSSMKRKLGMATGLLAKPATSDSERVLMVHPALLDAAIQSIILAFCYPDDGRLWSLHLPTSIRRIRVNPSLCMRCPDEELLLHFDSTLPNDITSNIFGDVDVYSDEQNAMFQMEGIECVPFSPASSANDTQLFATMRWDAAAPDGEAVAWDGRATTDEYELAYIAERLSFFYLRNLDSEIPKEHVARSNGSYKGLFDFASHVQSLAANGKHPYVKKEWADDNLDQIRKASERYPESLDLKIIRIVGEHMPSVVKDQTTILEHLMEDNLLDDYYAKALALPTYNNYLARMVCQIAHRYPHMNILEIGAGTGGAAKGVLDQLDDAFSMYNFTDISNGNFQRAQELFDDYTEKMKFTVLDIEKDISAQGFTEHSYDLIIASLALYATNDLENTMRNVHRLLKPGGYIIMLEMTDNGPMRTGFIFGALSGWRGVGAEDGRSLSPCITSAQWDTLLRKTGFSGIDAITPDLDRLPYPASIIASQAIDDRISFLRQPLSSSSHELYPPTLAGQDLIILGGQTLKSSRLIGELGGLLKHHFAQVKPVGSLEEVVREDISSMTTIISLTELDEAIFKNMTAEKFEGLKQIFAQSTSILWITEGCRADNPFSNITIGFGRSQSWELPDLRLQFLDIGTNGISAHLLAETFLRFKIASAWEEDEQRNNLLWSIEPEILLEEGQQLIPRLVTNSAQNDRYNSSRRVITKDIDPQSSPITIAYSGASPILQEGWKSQALRCSETTRHIVVKVSHSVVSSLKVASTGSLFFLFGTIINTAEQVIALSLSHTSIARVPETWSVPCHVAKGQEAQFISSVTSNLLALSLVMRLSGGDTLLVHDAEPAFASILNRRASEHGIQVVHTTTKSSALYPHAIFIHPCAPKRSVQAMLPVNVKAFVDLSGGPCADSVASHIAACVSPHCIKENMCSLFGKESYVYSASADSIQDLLRTAWLKSHGDSLEDYGFGNPDVVALSDIPDDRVEKRPSFIVNWAAEPTVPVKIEPVDSQRLFAPDKTYWLVGLTRGLGLSLCEWMVRHGARYVVLTSRDPKVDQIWVRKMKTMGATVKFMSNDITNKHDVETLYKEICSTLPPIAGVAQGAMVLRDTATRDMTIDNMQDVLRPKVDGSVYLHELFSENNLEFFIFFSSIVAVIGNIGQSNYSAANAFMASLAAQRRKRGLAGSVINIGPVLGIGFITRELSQANQDNLHKSGYMWLSEQDFHQLFAEAVVAGHPESRQELEITTGIRHVKANGPSKPIWINNPRFQHHVLEQADADLGDGNSKASIPVKTRLLVATRQEQVYEILKESLISKLQSMLQFSAESLGNSRSLVEIRTEELGIDSLNAVEIRSWFLKTLDVNMPVLKILGGASIGDLLDHAMKTLPEELVPGLQMTLPLMESANSTGSSTPPDSSSNDSLISSESSASELEDSTSMDIKGTLTPLFSESELSLKDSISRPLFRRTEAMSFGQSMFWFVNIYLEDQTTLNHTGSFHIKGNLRIKDLERAVQVVGQRHEALRTCFFADEDNQLLQGILEFPLLHLEKRKINDESEVEREFESMRQHVFDIQRGEVMRIVLLSLTSVEHYLVIGAHHINVDGISQQVLMADLEKAYSRQAMSSDILQYPDFSLRQQEDFKAGDWETDLTFWRNEFPDFPPPLPLLPLSEMTTRRALKKYATHRVDFRIDTSFAAHIQKISRQFNATPFHFYLAVFKTLLFRYVGTDDICIGMGDGNRSESEMFESIGPYVNLLPLRFRSHGSQTFSDTLQEARIKTYSALAHSRPPFEVLLTELGVPRSAAQSPLFQAFIDYRQATREKHSFGNCEFELKDFQAGRTAYDISLDIADSAGEVLLMFMVQEDIYKPRDAEILMSSYLSLLKSFSNDPALILSQPALFESTEIDQAIKLGQGPTLQSEWPETLTHQVDAVTQNFGERTAVRDSEGNSLTYAQMAKRVECIAASLLAADVGSGSRVAVFQEPTSDYICSLLAIMRIGAVYLPLDMGTPLPRLAVIVNDCQPGAILSHSATEQHVPTLRSQDSTVINVSALSESNFIPCTNRATPDSPAVILYTSGSTGIPKGIVLKHSSLRNEIEFSSHVYGFEREVVLLQSALSFDMSLTQIFTAIAYGGTVYVAPRSSRGDPIALTKLIASEAISFTGATPSEYISWLRYGETDSLRASQWKFAVSGGEQVTEALREAFRTQNKRDLRVYNAYGPTEITCSSNKMELFYANVDYSGSRIPAGFTTPNYSVYIVDENLNAVPQGVPGEILVGGAGVALGYLHNDDLTAERFIPDKFASIEYISKGWTTMHRTGDKGRFQDDGSILIEGRIVGDTQVKLRGLRIELRDVENTILETANGALTGVVVSVRRLAPLDSEFLVAHVVFSPSYPPKERGRCLKTLKSGLPLPQYMCPAMIIPIDRLLLSTSSKLDRLAISSLPLPHSQETDSDSVELSETEAQLKSIWEVVISKKITDFHTINAETDFFHIGGNSLLLVNLQALLKKKFHVTLSLVQLFESSTLGTMALRIESNSQTVQRVSIDWDSETQLLPDLLELTLPSEIGNSRNDPKVVALTGATGFLGKTLLRHLLNTEGIEKIHCVAMRTNSSRQSLPNSPKVVFHDGDLTLPRLGLSEEESRKVFDEVDAIIHNGADVSYLKSYQTLRSANLDSTRELVRMSLPRLIPIHFISTAGVALLSGEDTFGEISAAPYPPPIDGSDGYTASKWASERYLEKVAEKFPVSVCIHRPSSIMRDDTPELDILQNLLRYSRLMEAVPVSSNVRGAMDLVSVDNVAGSVVHELYSKPTQSSPGSLRYFNQSGDLDIPLPGLKAFLDAESGKDVATLGIKEWVGRAKSMGMHSMVAAFLENVEGMGAITFPKLIKRTV